MTLGEHRGISRKAGPTWCDSDAPEWVGVTPRGDLAPLAMALAAASAMLPRIWGHWARGLEGPADGGGDRGTTQLEYGEYWPDFVPLTWLK